MNKLAFLLVLLLTPMFCFVGCNSDDNNNKIVVSEVTHSIFYAPLYVAINNGYFADEGLEIELINANGSNNVMTAIISGQATIGLAGPETAVYTAQQSPTTSPKVFGQLTACDGSFLIGRGDKPFDIEDLRGKTIIAGRRGGMPAMTLQYALSQQGLIAGRDYTLNLDYDFGMVATAFEAGIGDYCTMFEPTASSYQATGKGKIVASIGQMGGYVPYTGFIAKQDYITGHSDQAEKFLRAIYRAYLFIMNANDEAIALALAPSFVSTTAGDIIMAINNYKTLNAFAGTPVMTLEGYERLCNIITYAGELKGPVPFENVIDNSIAENVVSYFKYCNLAS